MLPLNLPKIQNNQPPDNKMNEQKAELYELVRACRGQVELDRCFGIEHLPRADARCLIRPEPAQAAGAAPAATRSERVAEPPTPRRPVTAARPETETPRSPMNLSPEIPPAPEIAANDIFCELRAEVAGCGKCELCKTRTLTVFGEGDPATDLMFVGEGPGADEDRTGRPFVGRAGVLLTQIIQGGMKLPRERVFIGNIVKCRPPGNRVPTLSEMVGCRPYLLEQIAAIEPKVIVALGATAVQGLLGEKVAITKFRGTFQDWQGAKLMPTFHPSYLLRNYTREARGAVWQDMITVMNYLKEQGSPLAQDWTKK